MSKRPLVVIVALALVAPLRASEPEETAPPSSEASLAAIAGALGRIERLLRVDQSSRLVELRFRRLELLREEMSPLEAEQRSFRSMEQWTTPETRSAEKRIADLEEQIEAARLDGREGEIEMHEMNLREQRLQMQATKERLKLSLAMAERIEGELAGLRAERDRAVAEIDAMLQRLEQEARRERQP